MEFDDDEEGYLATMAEEGEYCPEFEEDLFEGGKDIYSIKHRYYISHLRTSILNPFTDIN